MTGGDPLPEPRDREGELPAAVGAEILRASLDSLHQFAASQEAMARSLHQEKVSGWWRTGLLTLAVLAVVVFLSWSGLQMQRQSQALVESLDRPLVAAAPEPTQAEVTLRAELERMRQQLADLQAAQAADRAEQRSGPSEPRTDMPPEPGSPIRPETATTRWQPEQPSGRPSGTAEEKPATGDIEAWKEGLLRGMERGAEFRPAPEAAAPPSDSEALDAAATARDPEALARSRHALAVAVNQLLNDSGMEWLTFVEGSIDAEGRGIAGAVMTSAGAPGSEAGTIQAGLVRLIRDPVTEEARWLCEEAYSTQGGVRVEYPGRRLVLEIPGRLPLEWVREPLAGLVQEPGAEEFDDSPRGLIDAYNRLLKEVEEAPVRFRSIERRSGGTLVNVVVEWWEAGRAGDLRELQIDQAWWELDEERALLTLVCEGGSLGVGDSRRPFFRGQYRLPLRNVHVQVWRTLPCVRRVAGETGASGTEPSGGGPPP